MDTGTHVYALDSGTKCRKKELHFGRDAHVWVHLPSENPVAGVVLNSRHASGGSEAPQYSVKLEDGEQHNFLAATSIKYRLPEATDTKSSPQAAPAPPPVVVVVRNDLRRQVSSETLATLSSHKAASIEKEIPAPSIHATREQRAAQSSMAAHGGNVADEKKEAPRQAIKPPATDNQSSFTIQGSPKLKRKRAPLANAMMDKNVALKPNPILNRPFASPRSQSNIRKLFSNNQPGEEETPKEMPRLPTMQDGSLILDRPLAAARSGNGSQAHHADHDRRGREVGQWEKSCAAVDISNRVMGGRPLTIACPRHADKRSSRDYDNGNDDSGTSDEADTNTLMVKVVLPRERNQSSEEETYAAEQDQNERIQRSITVPWWVDVGAIKGEC
jgi:hypothetical protein